MNRSDWLAWVSLAVTGALVLLPTNLNGGPPELIFADGFETPTPVNAAPQVDAGSNQTITLPASANLSGSVSDDGLPDPPGAVAISWSKFSGPGTVVFGNPASPITTASFSVDGDYVLRLTANDGALSAFDDVAITVNPVPDEDLPPDPTTVAPPIDRSVTTTIDKSTEFLYTGDNPIQTGVAPGTINPVRAAVIRGKVLDRNNNPLPGVTITVLNRPELGQTLSRADGLFDMAVNGGGLLTINYSKPGLLSAQRQTEVPWQDFSVVPDVALVALDTQVTVVNANDANMQVHQSSVSTDVDGSRKATLLFPSGTGAQMVMPGGATVPLNSLSVRATEYTVGTNGPRAMPGLLPPTSGYTYAVEFSVDEAIAAGAASVTFSQPVPTYVENFLNFPTGTIVPSGYYDFIKATWIPAPNGRVIKIVGTVGGLAEISITSNNLPASGAQLAALGITDAERQRLATLYPIDASLWRVPVSHFSPSDFNWPILPPSDAVPPRQPPPKTEDVTDSCESDGSIIECENQVLGKAVALVGTSYSLNYRSGRTPGSFATRTLKIPLSGVSVPASLVRIELTLLIAGREHKETFPAAANQTAIFTWDGLDAYGRPAQGRQRVTGSIGYVYQPVYSAPEGTGLAFARPGGSAIPTVVGRGTITLVQPVVTYMGLDSREIGLGGWSLSAHHVYDPIGQQLQLGSGHRVSGQSAGPIIKTVVGTGNTVFNGDNLPATQTNLSGTLGGLAFAPDGTLYIADLTHQRVRRVSPAGIVTTAAGTGNFGFSGDGGLATSANLQNPSGLAIGSDGSLYITVDPGTGGGRVRRVDANGIITTVAGTGVTPWAFNGDNIAATSANLRSPSGLAFGRDGSLYIADQGTHRVRRVGPDGIITTVAGNGTGGFSGDGGRATLAMLNTPANVAVDGEGNVYILDSLNRRIRRVNPAGIITTVAGTGLSVFNGDNIPATTANIDLSNLDKIKVGRDGSLYFSMRNIHRVRRIDAAGIITTVAGTGTFTFNGDGIPAGQANLSTPSGLEVDQVGKLLVGQVGRVRSVGSTMPGFAVADIAVASTNGSLLYQFSSEGRHLRTFHALTGAVLQEFTYDDQGRIVSVVEKTGGTDDVTTIQRDGTGNPTKVIGPYGQETLLSVDANGFLSSITNPAGETIQLVSNSGGLIATYTDPRGKTSQYGYDALGRLTSAADPASGTQSFARLSSSTQFEVTRTTGLGRMMAYKDEILPGDVRKRTITATDGTSSFGQENLTAGINTVTTPDNTVVSGTLGADPRFGTQAPYPKTRTFTPPLGSPTNTTGNKTAVLSDSNNPLSLTSLTETSAINGRTTTTVYTQANKTSVATSPAGRTTTVTIDTLGRPVFGQVAGINAANMTYDARGRLATITRGSGASERTVTFGYNAAGFVSTVTDALGRVTQVNYDDAGRVVSKVFPDGRMANMAYDAAGNLISMTPPGRPSTSFSYTDRNELSGMSPPPVAGGGSTQYTFNVDRQLTGMARPDNRGASRDFDSAGRLATRNFSTGGVITGTDQYEYDSAGRLSAVTGANGVGTNYSYNGLLLTGLSWTGTVSGDVEVVYDNSLRIASQSVNGSHTIAFTYDNDDLLTGVGALTIARSAQHGMPTATTLGVIGTAIGYNGFGEIASFSASANGGAVFSQSYTRDQLGRITHKVETIGGVTTNYDYTYSLAGQLVAVERDSLNVESYSYDDNGNRTNATVNGIVTASTHDDQDRLLTYGATTFTHNGAGDLQAKNNSGEITSYQYDQIGNLLSVTLPGGNVVGYLIDGRSRRVGKKVNDVFTHKFLYEDTLRPVAELDGSGTLVSRFVYAESHAPIYMVKGGSTYLLIKDEHGSVRLVVDSVSGAIAQRLDYDSFGRVLIDTNPGFQPFGFGGGMYDPDTGLVRFGARDYDASTGRWTTKDPKGIGGGDTNFYRYAHNDPINLADPTGTSAWETAFGFLEQFNTEVMMIMNPALAAQVATDNIYRMISEALGYPVKHPSMEDQISGRAMRQSLPGGDSLATESYESGRFMANCIGFIGGLFTGSTYVKAAGKADDVASAVGKATSNPTVQKTAKSASEKLDELLKQTIRDIGGNPDEFGKTIGWKTGGGNTGFGSGRL